MSNLCREEFNGGEGSQGTRTNIKGIVLTYGFRASGGRSYYERSEVPSIGVHVEGRGVGTAMCASYGCFEGPAIDLLSYVFPYTKGRLEGERDYSYCCSCACDEVGSLRAGSVAIDGRFLLPVIDDCKFLGMCRGIDLTIPRGF